MSDFAIVLGLASRTDDYLGAVRQTRPTLDEAAIAAFDRDIVAYQRV